MIERHAKWLVVAMLRKIVQRFGPRTIMAGNLYGWLGDKGRMIGVRLDDGLEMRQRWGRAGRIPYTDWSNFKGQIDNVSLPRTKSIVRFNIELLGHTFHLDNFEIDILELGVCYVMSQLVESFIDICFEGHDLVEVVAALLGATRDDIHRRLALGSRLRSSGLMYENFLVNPNCFIRASRKTIDAVTPPRKREIDIRRMFLGEPATPDLLWRDFDHIGQERDLALRILKGAGANKERGVNILIYGPPGTGKTEFCKVLAHKAGVALHVVGEADEAGGEMEREERLAALRMSQTLLSDKSSTVLLAEEMEDFFWGNKSRVYAHRLLEDNVCPILWTCNHIDSFEPSVLRRLTMALEIRTPDVSVRTRVWKRILTREGLSLPDEEAAVLASQFVAPPSMAASAVRGARLAAGGSKEIRQLVRGLAKVLPGDEERLVELPSTSFDATLAAADQDLEGLVQKLCSSEPRAFSLCLSGPPGTGKSAFARHLAKCLGSRPSRWCKFCRV